MTDPQPPGDTPPDESSTESTTPPDDQKPPREESAFGRAWREIWTGSIGLTILSILLALLVGALLIAISDPAVQDAASYFFSRPQDTFEAAWTSVSDAYAALFNGSIVNLNEYSASRALRPLAETLTFATPLIAAGLSVTLAFQAGLFNIGAEGQIILGAIFAGYIGFAWDLPVGIHLLVGIVGGLIGGALWGGIAGALRAKTGAHEVVVTIMLNYIARFLLLYLLTTTAFQQPGAANPISPFVAESAELPRIAGSGNRLHLGFVLAIAAAAFVWWLLSRSTYGFEFRSVGANPSASRTAGMSVGRTYTTVMLIAGALAGLAGVALVLGTERRLTPGISAGFGFEAITVALLGRATPWGTVAAGLLFGALRAGGVKMQADTGTPVDIVLVVQSLIVLFIAAPPLVRAIFRIKVTGREPVAAAEAKGWGA